MKAVLMMAYGSPRDLSEVEPYLKDIRGGRPPTPEGLADLTDRYAAIGGSSPLLEVTRSQSVALQAELDHRAPARYRTSIGMKHWHPYIAEAINEIGTSGAEGVIGLALAPHFSNMSIGGYASRVEKAIADQGRSIGFKMIDHWYDEPAFITFAAENLKATLDGWDVSDGSARVFFTAHSLPAKIIAEGDPYKDQLLASSKLISDACGGVDWEFAFQSASHTGIPWLGPDVLESLQAFADAGGKRAVIAPIGFVTDHLEILFDVDIECGEKARDLGIEMRRTPSPNAEPGFISALADVVLSADQQA